MSNFTNNRNSNIPDEIDIESDATDQPMMIPSRTKRQFEPDVDLDHEEQHIDEENSEDALVLLMNMFPDCDPRYIESRISWHMNSFDVVNLVCDELILRQYPLLKVTKFT